MIVVQISDTHIDRPGQYVYGHYDTGASFRRAIDLINAMSPQPDLVLHTGDLASHGSAAAYTYFREMLHDLKAPFRAIPGNHDERGAFRDAFADTDWMPQDGTFLHYVVDHLPVRIICCDSVIADAVPGELCPVRLAWLQDRLEEAPSTPTIVAMHHPPFASGMTGTTSNGLRSGGPELAELLRQHPQVQRLVAGHVHRPISTIFAGTMAYSAPTTCYPFALDMGDERVLRITDEPPAIAVHAWLEHAGPEGPGLITHTVPTGDWGEPLTLLKNGQRVLNTAH
jgi:3',5'-cyclic AMP phosphodiesterase CpdA